VEEFSVELLVVLKGAAVVQLILEHGKLRPRDVTSRLSNDDAKGMMHSSPIPTSIYHVLLASAAYYQVMYKLVTQAYLKPSTVLSHISPRDKIIQFEKEEKAKLSGFPTAKELWYAKETAKARLKREEEEAEKVGLVSG
jgi:DNA-directed RNA polymerase III subunit RPC3